MALTATEQKILDFALGTLPSWFTDDERELEFMGAAAKIMGAAQGQAAAWFEQALINDAVGPTGFDPDWLNQHAVDRNTARQLGESDEALRGRIRNVPDALTRITLISAAQAIVDAEAIVGTVAMIELPRDRAFFRDAASDGGTGGLFTAPGVGDVQQFTPDTTFSGLPYREIEETVVHKLVVSGAAVGAHDGTHLITGLLDDAITFVNAGGSASPDPTCTWTIAKYDRDDNLLDGFKDSFLGRGDRMASGIPTILFILPFGSTAGTAASVQEMLRQKRGAGIRGVVEYRQNP